MFHTLPVRGRQSHLVWPWEKSSVKIWPLPILDLYGQYVYQMKAENILNSNLTWKSRISYIKVGGKQFFMILPYFRWDFFFWNAKFSKKCIYNPPFFFHPHVHKMLNDKYMRFDNPSHLIHRMPTDWMSCGQILPPPGLLRVKGSCQSGRKVVTHDSKSDLLLILPQN